jgi:hypothetical protein
MSYGCIIGVYPPPAIACSQSAIRNLRVFCVVAGYVTLAISHMRICRCIERIDSFRAKSDWGFVRPVRGEVGVGCSQPFSITR